MKLQLLSNLVCSFGNSEVLTGESPDMLSRSMLYPWYLLYSSRRDGSGSRDVGSDLHKAPLEIRKGSCGDDARGLCFQLLRGVQQEWQFVSTCGRVSSTGYPRQHRRGVNARGRKGNDALKGIGRLVSFCQKP